MGDQQRDADVLWGEATPAAQPAPVKPSQAPERDADAMWAPPPPPHPQPRVVAKATVAKSDGEVMFGIDSAAVACPQKQDAGAAEESETAPADPARPEAQAAAEVPRDLIQVTDSIVLSIPSETFTEFDQQSLDQFAPILETHGIKGEAAQALFDLHLQRVAQEGADAAAYYEEQLTNAHDARVDAWRQETLNDPGLKAYGLKEAQSAAKATLSTYFDPSFREALKDYGLLNHPGLTRSLLHLRESIGAAAAQGHGSTYKRKYIPGYVRR